MNITPNGVPWSGCACTGITVSTGAALALGVGEGDAASVAVGEGVIQLCESALASLCFSALMIQSPTHICQAT